MSEELNEKDRSLKSQLLISNPREKEKNLANLTILESEPIIYGDYMIIDQVITLKNPPENLDSYECKEREVIMSVPLYDTTTGEFKGMKQTLGYIMLRGDHNESFFTYGYCEEKSAILFSASKQLMPNMFVSMTFKTHFPEMMNARNSVESSSIFFFFLPSTTDHKELISQCMEKVSLSPVNYLYEKFQNNFLPLKFHLIQLIWKPKMKEDLMPLK